MSFKEIYRIDGVGEEIVIYVEDASLEEVEEMREIAKQVKVMKAEWKLSAIARAIRRRYPSAKIYYMRIFK